ncbi:cell wall-active antibiotics response protein LiaF [Paenibacillus wynnii]|uniref:cell wall-active antibiotics response protein LiaF n=1 Tax=Paenibacillus wynnii TaxID=268407 RepID=UPI002790E6EC|nr:cell wall-active antibiotics response protein LiaF [Paenibacillus wynnii]MDQ0191914.1 lia operon protein LiaF [Paenibacillus wynnii]
MKRRLTSQIIGGLVLIGIGAIFLLRQLGYTDFSIGYVFSNFWPVILIAMGVKRLLATEDYSSKGSSFIGGIFFLAMGVFFLGRNLEWFDLSAGDFFKMFIPVMLIGGGLYVIFKPRHSGPPLPPVPPAPSYFPPGKDLLDVEPPKPLESTLDEQFEQKFGKPAGDVDSTSGRKTDWESYLSKDQATDDPELHSTGESRWKEKRERHERRHQERMERHARRHQDHWKDEYDGAHDDKDTTNRSAFIGDIHMGREHFQLKNTNLSQFIGDTVLDLTNAQIPYGETKINISAFIGDIKVYIPNDMDLGISVNSSSFIGDMQVLEQTRSGFMSSAQCRTPYYKESGKKIRINVSAFIGDIKVKTVG